MLQELHNYETIRDNFLLDLTLQQCKCAQTLLYRDTVYVIHLFEILSNDMYPDITKMILK